MYNECRLVSLKVLLNYSLHRLEVSESVWSISGIRFQGRDQSLFKGRVPLIFCQKYKVQPQSVISSCFACKQEAFCLGLQIKLRPHPTCTYTTVWEQSDAFINTHSSCIYWWFLFCCFPPDTLQSHFSSTAANLIFVSMSTSLHMTL